LLVWTVIAGAMDNFFASDSDPQGRRLPCYLFRGVVGGYSLSGLSALRRSGGACRGDRAQPWIDAEPKARQQASLKRRPENSQDQISWTTVRD